MFRALGHIITKTEVFLLPQWGQRGVGWPNVRRDFGGGRVTVRQ